VGRRKIAKKIAKNKRCYANTLRPRSRMLLKVMIGASSDAHFFFLVSLTSNTLSLLPLDFSRMLMNCTRLSLLARKDDSPAPGAALA